MKLNVTKTVLLALVSAVAIGSIAPAFAQSSTRACRRVVNIEGGPDQPRAVAGLDRNQIPAYLQAGGIYSGATPATVIKVGQRVNLLQPMLTQFVLDPNGQNGEGTLMIAIQNTVAPEDTRNYMWIPLSDAAQHASRDGVVRVDSFGKANLGHCAVRGMW